MLGLNYPKEKGYLDKIEEVVYSCKTPSQIENGKRYLGLFLNKMPVVRSALLRRNLDMRVGGMLRHLNALEFIRNDNVFNANIIKTTNTHALK